MTTPADSFRELLELDLSHATVTLYAGAATGKKRTLEFQHMQTTAEPSAMLRDIVAGLQSEWSERVAQDGMHLANYDGQDAAAVNEIEFLQVGDHVDIESALAPLQTPVSLPVFKGDERTVAALKMLAIRVQFDDGRHFCAITYFTGSKRLMKRGVKAMLFQDNQFNAVADDVYEIPNRVDAVLWDRRVFVNNSRQFSIAFSFHDKVIQQGATALTFVQGAIPFRDFQSFSDKCAGSPRKLAKLAQAVSVLNGKTFNMEKAKSEMQRLGHSVEFVSDADGVLKIDASKSDDWVVIKLLCGDYVRGLLDDVDYEATRKRAWKSGGAASPPAG